MHGQGGLGQSTHDDIGWEKGRGLKQESYSKGTVAEEQGQRDQQQKNSDDSNRTAMTGTEQRRQQRSSDD